MAMNAAQLEAFGPGVTCDRCGVDPSVKYHNDVLDLDFLFCGHHSNELELGLLAKGFTITVDVRDEAGKSLRRGNDEVLQPQN